MIAISFFKLCFEHRRKWIFLIPTSFVFIVIFSVLDATYNTGDNNLIESILYVPMWLLGSILFSHFYISVCTLACLYSLVLYRSWFVKLFFIFSLLLLAFPQLKSISILLNLSTLE
jgi:hypothetical protein